MRSTSFSTIFCQTIPTELEEGTLYVSIEYATATHRCFCGCGQEVVTPFSPTDWMLLFDGDTVSLRPSIGSWSLPCKSHYWLSRNRVAWSRQWTEREIEEGRRSADKWKAHYFEARARGEAPRPFHDIEDPDEWEQ